MRPIVKSFFDPSTSTFSHVVHSGTGSACAIIDSVLGFSAHSGRTNTESADQLLNYVDGNQLQVDWILETHIHADHLSAASYLKEKAGGKIAASKAITSVSAFFCNFYHLTETPADLSGHFDHLFDDDECFHVGPLKAKALPVPGHTPADLAYAFEGTDVFVGDTIFPPDVGTARCDFPNGSAEQLFDSVTRLLALPAETRLHMCHDYPPSERSVMSCCTVEQQREHNIHVGHGTRKHTFVAMRSKRDQTLDIPRLLLPSIQVNLRAGRLPEAESNGTRYLKIPLDRL